MHSDSLSLKQIAVYHGILDRVYADFDGDGNEEYIETMGKGLTLCDFDGPEPQTTCHILGSLDVNKIQPMDITGDPAPEIFVSVKAGNKAWIEVWSVSSSFGKLECSFYLRTEPVTGSDINNDGVWDGSIDYYQTLDVNGDGQGDILAGISTGYDIYPRSVIAYNGRDGQKIWEFPAAGILCPIECMDVNGDGAGEVIFGSWAPCNGSVSGDMDDCHSYLMCLSREGKLLWKHVVGGAFTGPSYLVGEPGGEAGNEIVCNYADGDLNSKSTRFELQIRAGETGEVERYFRLPSAFGMPFSADLDRDGRSEIVTGNTNGYIFLFDDKLELMRKSRVGNWLRKCAVCEVADVNNDGQLEIIARVSEKIMILDSQLQLLNGFSTGESVLWNKVHFFQHPFYGGLISLMHKVAGQRKTVLVLETKLHGASPKVIISPSRYSLPFLLLIFALGFATSLVRIKIMPLIVKQFQLSGYKSIHDKRDTLLQTLSVFGHGKTATSNLDRLNLLFKNLPAENLSSPEYWKKINETVKTYLEFTSHQLGEIIKKSKDAEIQKANVESLDKNLRKLGSLLEKYSRRGEMPIQMNRFSRDVPSLVESLEDDIESIRNELARYYSCDVVVVMHEVLAAVSPAMKKENIRVKGFHVEGEINSEGFFERTELASVIEELIANSMHSLKDSARKDIGASVKIGEKKILIEISDTGCGIKKEDFENIFHREYSTKKEGGFGLYHARMIVNKYGGNIKIGTSEPGKGTTMKVEIKRT